MAIAVFSDKLDVKLITTVAGNVALEKVTSNALKLLTFWNKKIPVARGAERPLIEEYIDASHVHGQSGLAGFDFPAPDTSLLCAEHAVEKMRHVITAEDKITLAAIGPLTNVALLFAMYPEVKPHISRLVMMGGSLTRGNRGVMSEFNFATDPHAAKIVFDSGVPLVMADLDIGRKASIPGTDIEKIKGFGKTGAMLYALLKKYRSGTFETGLRMYDSCALAYILKPELFTAAQVFADIELSGTLTSGCSVVDMDGFLQKKANTTVFTDVDVPAFRSWFTEALSKCD